MHTYDPTRRPPQQSPIPSMRPAHEQAGGVSATPIYDALYAEYRRLFRTLPGDRHGEEGMGFTAFGTGPHGSFPDLRYGMSYGGTPSGMTGGLSSVGYGMTQHGTMYQPELRHGPGYDPGPGPRYDARPDHQRPEHHRPEQHRPEQQQRHGQNGGPGQGQGQGPAPQAHPTGMVPVWQGGRGSHLPALPPAPRRES